MKRLTCRAHTSAKVPRLIMPIRILPIRILIVDHYAIMRTGIESVCSPIDDFEVVAKAGSMSEAFSLVQSTSPDVVVIEPRSFGNSADSPSEDLLGKLRRFRDACPGTRILVFTASDCPGDAGDWMRSGADGFLTKEAGVDVLASAIRCVHGGRSFVCHTGHSLAPPKAATKLSDLSQPVDLSARELEVLALIADGMTNKQAAAKLFLSVKTVETYRARVMRKHQLKDRSELVRFAKHQAIGRPTELDRVG